MNIYEIVSGNGDGRSARFAGVTISSMVGIIGFQTRASFANNGIESIICPSSITISLGTINQHLFREVYFAMSSNGPYTFNGSGGSKSPATSTLSLISDRPHHICPIMRIGGLTFEWSVSFDFVFFGIFILNFPHQDCVFEFFEIQIRILVDSLFVGGETSFKFDIMCFDGIKIGHENGFSLRILLKISVSLLEFQLEFFPLSISRESGTGGDKS